MRRLLGLLAVFFALQAAAEMTNSGPPSKASAIRNAPSLGSQPATGKSRTLTLKAPPRPNEIVKGKVSYSGISVAVVKNGHPLQLLSPLASPQYGEPEDNVVRDSATGKVSGLKLIAIHF